VPGTPPRGRTFGGSREGTPLAERSIPHPGPPDDKSRLESLRVDERMKHLAPGDSDRLAAA